MKESISTLMRTKKDSLIFAEIRGPEVDKLMEPLIGSNGIKHNSSHLIQKRLER